MTQPIVKSEYPCFWFARYNTDERVLRVPFCPECNQLAKIDETSETPRCINMRHGHLCGCESVSYEQGTEFSLTESGELFEFDDSGEETVNFSFLPTKNLVNFGLINLMNRQQSYILDLNTGEAIINGTRLHVGYARTEFPIEGHFLISKKLDRYGGNRNLLQFKVARSDVGGRTIIDSFNIGYQCKVDDVLYEVILSINTRDFQPLISVKEIKDASM